MEIPTSRGMFTPQATNYHPSTEGVDMGAVANNLGAMFDAKDKLAIYQRQQAAKTIASVDLEGLTPEMATAAHGSLEDYLKDYQAVLAKGQSVNSRRKLGYQDEVAMSTKRFQIQQGIDWMKGRAKGYDQAVGRALTVFKDNPEQAKEWRDQWLQETKAALAKKDFGAIPDPEASLMDYMQRKPPKVTADKSFSEMESLFNSVKQGLSYQGYTKPSMEETVDYIKANYPVEGETWKNYIKPRLAKNFGLDPTATPDDVLINKFAEGSSPRIRTKNYPVVTNGATIQQTTDEEGNVHTATDTTGQKYAGKATLDDGTEITVGSSPVTDIVDKNSGETIRTVTAEIDNPKLKPGYVDPILKRPLLSSEKKSLPRRVTVTATVKGVGSSKTTMQKQKIKVIPPQGGTPAKKPKKSADDYDLN